LLLLHKGKNRLHQNYFQLLDRITPACAVAAIFLLIGSFASSKIIGRPTDSFVGTVFIQPVVTGLSKVPCCIMRSPDGNNPLEKIIVKKDPVRLKAKTSHRSLIFYLFFKPGLSEQLVNEFLVGDVKAYFYDMSKFMHEPGTEPLRYRIFLDANGQYIARVITLGISRYPVQLFDAFALLIISALLFWRRFRNERRAAAAGKDFGIFMMCFWSAQIMLQFLKEPEKSWLGTDMNTVVVLDILFILTGAIVLFKSVRNVPAVHY
jgi:phosphatidylglycerol---prolipoprotein diacylglyceryl transferase